MYQLSNKSLLTLSTCHPDLVLVVQRAIQICEIDFGVSEGERSKERQAELIDTGASHTLNSLHIKRPQDAFGVRAVDLFAWVDDRVSWSMYHYKKIAKAMFRAAIECQVQIEWGGHWNQPEDGPHFQLSPKYYK